MRQILERVAILLEFTFEIHEMGAPQPGEATWTPALIRAVPESDLVLSYWARTPDRLDRIALLAGHIDMSATLVSRLQPRESTIYDSFTSFTKPFTLPLWCCLGGMIFLAGCADYLLERHSAQEEFVEFGKIAVLRRSLYEYILCGRGLTRSGLTLCTCTRHCVCALASVHYSHRVACVSFGTGTLRGPYGAASSTPRRAPPPRIS